MDNHSNNLGDRFKSAVNEALNTGDFTALDQAIDDVGKTVSAGINRAEDEIYRQLNGTGNIHGTTVYRTADTEDMPEWQRRQIERQKRMREEREAGNRPNGNAVRTGSGRKIYINPGVKNRNRVAKIGFGLGIAEIVTTSICLVTFVSIWIPFLALHIFPTAAFVLIILSAVSTLFLYDGIRRVKLFEKARKYAQACGDKLYESLDFIAEKMHVGEGVVRKELRKLIKKGFFPEGHLDPAEKTFMLTDDLYKEAKKAEDARIEREKEEAKAAMGRFSEFNDEHADAAPESELDAMIKEGSDCIGKLVVLNEQIEGEVISEKLSNLEQVLRQIFATVKEHPEQMGKMHKLMDYYLPTTIKLVEAYKEYDSVTNPGKEITDAKEQIENTLDTINEAFNELLNNLFSESVMDVTTDAQVLKTMLAKEGLSDSNGNIHG